MSRVYQPGEKTHRDENFPVASLLIRKAQRPAVLAFYRFARAADDVADSPDLTEAQKLAQLDAFEATLLGKGDTITEACELRAVLQERRLPLTHPLDLLRAFRQDARQSRYADWDALMGYCMFSAAPVGRFVLSLHGESEACFPASDDLCNALQIINHLQDCQQDYLRLNRVYIPQEMMQRNGISEADLALPEASAGLLACVHEMVRRTQGELRTISFAPLVKDLPLALEVAVIERLAQELLALLSTRDPLSQNVHFSTLQTMRIALLAIVQHGFKRWML